jgi:hypothetical protein
METKKTMFAIMKNECKAVKDIKQQLLKTGR